MVVVADAEVASVELCIVAPLDAMQTGGLLTYVLFYEKELPCETAWRGADLVLGMRCVRTATVRLVQAIRAEGIPFIYMVDDDFESIPTEHWLARHYRSYGAARNFREFVALADNVIAFSRVLADKLEREGKSTIVAPAISGLDIIDRQPACDWLRTESGELRLGFAGSPTHKDDVDIIADVLARMLERHGPELFVESIGQRWDSLVGHPRYRHFDQVRGVKEFGRFLLARQWDIGLAPMENTPFNRAKTDNKYRTYSALGLAAVYTRIPALAEVVRDGETGRLIENDAVSWSVALDELISDPQLRRSMGEAAFDDHRSRYTLGKVVQCYRDCFSYALAKVRLLIFADEATRLGTSSRKSLLEIVRAHPAILVRCRAFDDVTADDVTWAHVVLVDTDDHERYASARRMYAPFGHPSIAFLEGDFFEVPSGFETLRRRFEGEQADRLEAELSRVERIVVTCSAPSPRLQSLEPLYFANMDALSREILDLAARPR